MTNSNTESQAVIVSDRADGKSERRVLLLRLAVTAILCGFLAWQVDLEAFWKRFATLRADWILAAFLVVLGAIIVSAWKWSLILRERGHPLRYGQLLRHYFVGLFFNNVLPTSIGGDAVRAWETTKDTGDIPEAVGSVMTERLIAGIALGMTALLGLPFIEANARVVLFVAIFLIVNLAAVALILSPKIANSAVSALLPGRFANTRETVLKTVSVVRDTLRTKSLFVKIFVLSVLFQVLVAAVNACIFWAMDLDVSLAACVTLTPMIFTVTMLPISISGLGVREAAYWFFFAHVGVSQVDAVAASLAFFVIVAIASLPGALLFAFKQRPARKQEPSSR